MVRVTNKEDNRISKVNGLLRLAFNRRVAGDFDHAETVPLPRINRLYMIVDTGVLGFHRVIGQFDSEDGSQIRVLPGYEKSAKKYAGEKSLI